MAPKKKTAKKAAKKKRAFFPPHIVRAVARGVKFLDLVIGRKEWLGRMNMKQFDIESTRMCVAGQIFDGNGRIGYSQVQNAFENLELDGDEACKKFGFLAEEEDMPKLQDLWALTIVRLKKQAKMAL